jgi:hypothetical protein
MFISFKKTSYNFFMNILIIKNKIIVFFSWFKSNSKLRLLILCFKKETAKNAFLKQ